MNKYKLSPTHKFMAIIFLLSIIAIIGLRFAKPRIEFKVETVSKSARKLNITNKVLLPATGKYFIIGGNKTEIPEKYKKFITLEDTSDSRVRVLKIKNLWLASPYINIIGSDLIEIKDNLGKRIVLYLP